MTKLGIIIISLLVVFTALIAWVLLNQYKRRNSEKMWKLLGLNTFFWEGIIWVSCGLTILILLLLKWTNLLTF